MHPRKLARSVARHRLDKEGATGYNKARFANGTSYFALYWNEITKQVLKEGIKHK